MEDIWLGLETKVRSLIKEIIEPTIRRVLENKDSIDKIHKQQEIMTYRLDDLDMNIGKYTRKIATVDDMAKKILEFEASLRLVDVRFNRDREEIKTEVSAFTSKLIHFEEYLNVFDHTKEALKNDLTTLTYSIHSLKSYSEDKIQAIREEMWNRIADFDSLLMKNDVKIIQVEKTLKGLGKEIGEMNTILHTTAHVADELVKKTKDLRKSYKFMKKNAFDSIEKLRLISIKNMTEAQASDRKILDVIVNELPIRNRLLISEVLFSVLIDPYQRHQLAQFELQKYAGVNEAGLVPELRTALAYSKNRATEILSRPLPDKASIVSPGELNVRLRQRKGRQRTIFLIKKENNEQEAPTRKDSISMAKKESKAKPAYTLEKINEEPLPRKSSIKYKPYLPEKPPDLNNFDKTITNNIDKNLRKSELMSIKDYSTIKDELKIARFNTLIHQNENIEDDDDVSFGSSRSYQQIDYQPLIEEARAQANSLINELKEYHDKDTKYLNDMIKELKEDLENKHRNYMMHIEKCKAEAGNNVKELQLIINQALSECNSAITMRKRDQSDFGAEIKGLHQKAESIEGQYGVINEKIGVVNKNVELVLESMKIMNALSKQDEIDRESIALMGYKEGKNNKCSKPVVSIEKQCLSCTGQGSVVLTAFKIACLAYSPSQIVYQGTTYTRKDLIDIQAQVLSSLNIEKKQNASSIIEELHGGRSKTFSSIKIRPLSVPSSNITLNTPRADFFVDEFPPLLKKHGNLLST